MTYVITEKCLSSMDRSCLAVCPVDCIYDASQMLVINPDECIDCGACEPECPVDAIYHVDDVPAPSTSFITINAAITEDAERVDEALDRYLNPSLDPGAD